MTLTATDMSYRHEYIMIPTTAVLSRKGISPEHICFVTQTLQDQIIIMVSSLNIFSVVPHVRFIHQRAHLFNCFRETSVITTRKEPDKHYGSAKDVLYLLRQKCRVIQVIVTSVASKGVPDALLVLLCQ